uniref:FAM21/CAPZIP domain-containing protein n=1 Tax=Oryzias latipes TaxID=8090 RepID=A0A3P9IBX8_ORYLA
MSRMEEEAPPPRSVFELAKKFKDSSAAQNIKAEKEPVKPVRRRPPQTLKIPKASGGEQSQPPSGLTSPQSSKPRRSSALIEKLQANLTLSPTGPPLKSPGIRATPLTFTPPSPGSALVSMVTTVSLGSPTSPLSSPVIEEEGPVSFEAPPSATEGAILTSINKARARVSIRRRPPSRRNRKSSSGDEACINHNTSDSQPNPRSEEEERATEQEGRGEEPPKEDQIESPPQQEDIHEEEMKSSVEEGAEERAEEEEPPSSSLKVEEEKSKENQEEDSAEREPGKDEKEE